MTSAAELWIWGERPVLAHIYKFAQARRVCPWATLGMVLVRVTVAVKPFVVLPAFIGGYGSLNLFVGLVGPSGAHKGTAMSAAVDAVPMTGIDTIGPGSGEGIAHLFAKYQPPDKKTGDPGGIVQHTTNMLLYAPEIDTLGALVKRQASTLFPELRKAWSGEGLGFAYVDPTKRITLRAHTYRLGLVVGIQPEQAAPILDDAGAGTPQRFLWMPTADADIPDVRPPQPDPWTWRSPAFTANTPGGKVILPVCDTAAEAIDAAAVARHRNPTGDLDAHALYARLKTAAALTILDQRTDVTDDDWRLAGTIQTVSDRTRADVVYALETRDREDNVRRGQAQGERNAVAHEVATDHAVQRVTRNVLAYLSDGEWMWAGALCNRVAYRDRANFPDAIEGLIAAGLVEYSLGSDGDTVTRYRLTPTRAR